MTRRRSRWDWLVVVLVVAMLGLFTGSVWSSTGTLLSTVVSAEQRPHDAAAHAGGSGNPGEKIAEGASPMGGPDTNRGWGPNPTRNVTMAAQRLRLRDWPPGGDQNAVPTFRFDDPIATLKAFWATNAATLRDATTYPVGGEAHLSATPNVRGGVVLPPLCGVSLAKALGVTFSVDTERGEWSTDADGRAMLSFTVDSQGAVYRDVVVVGRLVGRKVMLHAYTTRIGPQRYRVVFGPLPTTMLTAAMTAAMGGAHNEAHNEAFSLDILVTWIGPFFFGQRWVLPDRNDNPAFAEKKRKCLSLSLHGACDRFGLRVVSVDHVTIPKHMWRQHEATDAADRRPICSGADVASPGYWERLDPSRHGKAEIAALTDPVGLNTFNGSEWRWQVGHCRVHVYTRQEALQCFRRRGVRNVGLFGDSMMVEFVNQLSLLFDAPIRQGKYKRLRYMEFTTAARDEASGDGGTTSLRVRFSRSYTTREGQSVIASPATILSQLQSTQPEVILGNLAVLHWQQNMMSLEAWKQNLQHVAQLLTPTDNSRSWQRALHGGAYYLGPTLVQMGRTQGLEPSRTRAFADAAYTILGGAAQQVGGVDRIADAAGYQRKRRGDAFTVFAPYEASVARRESAYDGQHWACYHTYGGVSQTIAQLWLHQVCHDGAEGAGV